MNTVTGIIVDRQIHKYKIVRKTDMKTFNMNLGSGRTWKLGIDPASHFTGLALIDSETRYVVLLDCARDKCLMPDDFYQELFLLIKRLVKNQKIERVVNEKPFVKNGYSRASEILLKLRGKIEDWVKTIPELVAGEFVQINVNVWKSRVIDKSKGSNRFNQKGAVAEDLIDLIPELGNYYNLGIGGDLDSFDALGAILGYQKYAYTPEGYKKICGEKEKSHYSLVGYKWIDGNAMDQDFLAGWLGEAFSLVKPVLLEYNTEYSFIENVMMASTNNDAVITMLPQAELQQFQWKFNIDITEKNKVMIALILRTGHYPKSVIDYITNRFDGMSERLGGE